MTLLPHIEIEPQVPADAAVIWLHGLGANGHDFEPVVSELNLPDKAPIRFIFPHAPSMPVTINGGLVMPAWYDILDLDFRGKIDEEGIKKSAAAIRLFIDRERERGIHSERIVIAGFSQGGAVGYQTALTYPEPLAGLLALSTYLATWQSLEPDPANGALPILICHGLYDSVVPEILGQRSWQKLTEMGYKTEYKTYPMDHHVCGEEISDIAGWFESILLD